MPMQLMLLSFHPTIYIVLDCQVIADFDATLTKYWIDGRRGQSK